MASNLQQAVDSLQRVQNFDVAALPQREKLGVELSFEDATKPAQSVIELFKMLPVSMMPEFPHGQREQIRKQADAFFNALQEIMNFSVAKQSEGNIKSQRDALIARISSSYEGVFNALMPLISYANSRTVDVGRLETEARSGAYIPT